MTDDAAASPAGDAYVSDDVSAVTSRSRRAVDFSINSLLSSQAGRTESTSLSDDTQFLVDYTAGVDSSALLHHRLAAAAFWYPWLHSVASTASKQHLGKLSISTIRCEHYFKLYVCALKSMSFCLSITLHTKLYFTIDVVAKTYVLNAQ